MQSVLMFKKSIVLRVGLTEAETNSLSLSLSFFLLPKLCLSLDTVLLWKPSLPVLGPQILPQRRRWWWMQSVSAGTLIPWQLYEPVGEKRFVINGNWFDHRHNGRFSNLWMEKREEYLYFLSIFLNASICSCSSGQGTILKFSIEGVQTLL